MNRNEERGERGKMEERDVGKRYQRKRRKTNSKREKGKRRE